MQFRNMMLAMGFAALVLGTGKGASSKDEAAHVDQDSSMKAATATKGESKNAWYYGSQGKDEARMTEDARAKTTDHEYKATKTKGHSDMFTKHVAPPSKETEYKSKEDDKKGSNGYMDSGSSEESYHDSGTYSNEDHSHGDHTSAVSIGPEETNLMKSASRKAHTSAVSIGPEETTLSESTSTKKSHATFNKKATTTKPLKHVMTESAVAFNKNATTAKTLKHVMTESAAAFNKKTSTTKILKHVMTSVQAMIYASETSRADNMMAPDSTTTIIEMEMMSLTEMMEATATVEIDMETSFPAVIMMDTSSAPPPPYTTAPYPATFVANVPSSMMTIPSTPAAVILSTGGVVANATTSALLQFTGGSERLNSNSLIAMAFFMFTCMLM